MEYIFIIITIIIIITPYVFWKFGEQKQYSHSKRCGMKGIANSSFSFSYFFPPIISELLIPNNLIKVTLSRVGEKSY